MLLTKDLLIGKVKDQKRTGSEAIITTLLDLEEVVGAGDITLNMNGKNGSYVILQWADGSGYTSVRISDKLPLTGSPEEIVGSLYKHPIFVGTSAHSGKTTFTVAPQGTATGVKIDRTKLASFAGRPVGVK